MAKRVEIQWVVGPYLIEGVSGHGLPAPHPEVMYQYKINGRAVDPELYPSLDRALVSAVGAHHMGHRGAGGNAVGTAADWFCVMIGLDEQEADGSASTGASAPALVECAGSHTGWLSGALEPEPSCRQCGATWEELRVEKPKQRFGGYGHDGLVPAHSRKALP
jgi:hypothetical protein